MGHGDPGRKVPRHHGARRARPEVLRHPDGVRGLGNTNFGLGVRPKRSCFKVWPALVVAGGADPYHEPEAHMFHDTIRVNLVYAKPGANETELLHALANAQLLGLVESLPDGLDTLVGDRGYLLSGGKKQRMAIARMLLEAPDVVVLDEATAHLDSQSAAAVQEALRTALESRTSLVIAHRLSTVRDADLVLVIDGPHRETWDPRRPLCARWALLRATGCSSVNRKPTRRYRQHPGTARRYGEPRLG